ncbi:MAG: cytochrome b/b6 domain-containing protein [bacterium]
MAKAERVFYHTITARICHFIALVSMIFLILTGFNIYAPTKFNLFGNLNNARLVHFIFMYLISFAFLFRFLHSIFITGDIKELYFGPKQAFQLIGLIKYYACGIFFGWEKPKYGKYNPGQRLLYGLLYPLGLVFMAWTGFVLYWPDKFVGSIQLVGGLQGIKLLHFIGCWILTILTIGHAYFGTCGATPTDAYKSLITGYQLKH